MTGNSLTVRNPSGAATLSLPREIESALWGAEWDSTRALAILKRDRAEGSIPALAKQAQDALVPASHEARVDRLTMMGMAMASGRDDASATAWLHLNSRLLADLPEDILADALDEIALTSTFLPSTAEIRAKADPKLADRRRDAARLDALSRLMAAGIEVLPAAPCGRPWEQVQVWDESQRCTPEQAREVLEEFPQFKGLARDVIEELADPGRKEREAYEQQQRMMMGDEAYEAHRRWELGEAA